MSEPPDQSAETPHERGEITSFTPLPSDPNILSVRVGRRVVARIRVADLDALELRVGQPWTPALEARIRTLKAKSDLRKRALGFLGRRAYSKAELASRLARHHDDEALVQVVLEELEGESWLDDEAYARQIVDEVGRKSPASARLHLLKLQQHGIDEQLAQRVVSESLRGIDPVESALDLARTRLASLKSVPPRKAADRIAGLLARRGFEADVVQDVIARLKLIDEEPRIEQ